MSTTKNADGSISIASMSLVDYLPEVIKASKDGYVLDVNCNTGYPQSIGHLLTVTMFPTAPKQTNPVSIKHTEDVQEVSVEGVEVPVTAVKIDGRKKQK
jgi:hypothetical protein